MNYFNNVTFSHNFYHFSAYELWFLYDSSNQFLPTNANVTCDWNGQTVTESIDWDSELNDSDPLGNGIQRGFKVEHEFTSQGLVKVNCQLFNDISSQQFEINVSCS